MRFLKILVLNYEYPPIGGGAGVISKYHAEKLAEYGHKVTVITSSLQNKHNVENVHSNLKIIRLPTKRKYVFRSSIIEKLKWIHLAYQYVLHRDKTMYNIVIAHFSIPGGFIAFKLLQKRNIPYIVVSHGQDIPWFYPRQMFFYHLLLFPLIKKILLKSKGVFVQSKQMYDNASGFLGKNSSLLKKIPNGADECLFSSPHRQHYSSDKPLKLIFAGRLTKQKRPEKLIEIAKILKQKNINFIMTICGDGKLRPKLIKLSKLHSLSNYIHFESWVNQKKLIQLYSNHHIMLAPSDSEGMSIAILEALFNGLYIITTPVSGNQELISDKTIGALVENHPRNFVEAILDFQQTKYTERNAAKYRNQLIKNHNWNTVVKKYEDVLLKICNDE